MAETDRDEKLSQAYRALPLEEPPRALDAAILAAARRKPVRWRVPVSIAAVVVLAVGVTLRMLPHEPGTESVALAPQVMETPRPAAPPVQSAAKPARDAPAETALARAPRERAEQSAAAPVMSDEVAARSAEARARNDVAGAKRPEAPAPQAAQGAQAVGGLAAERAPAAAAPAPRALASAKLAEPATPEAWLERIAELKKQGRVREADESLAEFKKRYPAYKIPEALTR